MYPKRQTIVRITFWTLGESRGKNTRMNVAPSFELGSATGAGCRCPDHFVSARKLQRRAVVVLLFAASNFSSKSYELSLFERYGFFELSFLKNFRLEFCACLEWYHFLLPHFDISFYEFPSNSRLQFCAYLEDPHFLFPHCYFFF